MESFIFFCTIFPLGVIIIALFVDDFIRGRREKLEKIQKALDAQYEKAHTQWVLKQLEDPTVIPLHERDASPCDDVQDTYRSHAP